MPKTSRRKSAPARRRATSRSRSPRAATRPSRPAAKARSASTGGGAASDRALRALLGRQLDGGHAYTTFAAAIRDLPVELRGVRPKGAAHSPWQVLEHMRISQWDIVDFTRDPAHRSPAWPSGYWPEDPEPPDARSWDASVREFERELAAMKELIADPKRELFTKIDHPEAQPHHTLAREAMVLSEHNGYHIAELIVLRRLLGAWPA